MNGGLEEEWKAKIHPLVPKKLDELLVMDKVKDMAAEDLVNIWKSYHAGKRDCVAATLQAEEWKKVETRSKECPMFVYPVKKKQGQFFVLLLQWNKSSCVLTFLEDYQRSPHTALPYMYFVAYPDFIAKNGVSLLRAEFLPYLLKTEASLVLADMLDFYIKDDKFEHVRTFNLDPARFDFNKVFFD